MEHKTVTEEELQGDKKYFKQKRQLAIDRLNRKIESGSTEEIQQAYTSFIRLHKQWELINDALVIHKFPQMPRN